MPTVESLRRKLTVGEELHSVVSTMKGLAAVSIHEYEKAVRALREYTTTIEQGLQILLMTGPEVFRDRIPPVRRTAMVVIGTDQGLCGPLNREIARHALEWSEEHGVGSDDRHVVAIGMRVARELELVRLDPSEELKLPGSVDAVAPLVEELLVAIDDWRSSAEVGRVVVFFQHPLSRIRRAPRTFQVVPPDTRRLRSIGDRPWPTNMLPASPHGREELLAGLLRQDLFIALFRALAEGKAAEHGARLAAMQAAEQNIEERLDRLQRDFHQLRQSEITGQLLDVVSGFEVLRDTEDL